MAKYPELNENQRLSIEDDSKHIRIIAGAGSGKTRVLTMRVCHLIDEKNVNPYNILAITFTNKAANEMKSRILNLLGDKGSGAFISTIHSLCVRILHEDIEALGYPRNFSIVDQDDQNSILKEAYKEIGINKKEYPYGQMLDYIANNKYENISIKRAFDLTYGEAYLISKAKVYEYYVNRLHDLYALDFDDLILFTLRLFKENPYLLEKWSSKFHYIHVDEFQDVDRAQYELIQMLSRVHDNLYVVGDPDQTIYTWRGADINIIVGFDKDYPDTKTIVLDQNYRSTNNILQGANSVIRNNKARVEKVLFSKNGDGDKIKHKTCMSESGEAEFVVKEIVSSYNNGLNLKDIAVLYRTNYLSREIEKVLIENRIPYVVYGGIRFYERAEVKDILSYLRLIVNGDDLSFKRVINKPKRGIGEKTIEAIFDKAKSKRTTMYEIIKNDEFYTSKPTFSNFVSMIEQFKSDIETKTLENVLKDVLNVTGYRSMLENSNETERLENVKSLIDDINEYQEIYPDSTLSDYLQMISLYIDRSNEHVEDSVNLLTIHSAKGLEFDTVFVIGASEGIFPSERTISEGPKGLEEERRLAYVAYTRAKNRLFITDSCSFSYVLQGNKTTSRFVSEIDPSYIEDLTMARKVSIYDDPDRVLKERLKEEKTIDEYSVGDKLIHTIYGEGIVVSIDKNILTIAFNYPYGIKKILAGHSSLKKAEDNYS